MDESFGQVLFEPLRRHWDAIVRGEAPQPESLAPPFADIIDRLHALDRSPAEPSLSPDFAQRLEARLMNQARSADTLGVSTPPSVNGHAPTPLPTNAMVKIWSGERRRSPASLFSTLALFGLILGIAALVWITRGGDEPGQHSAVQSDVIADVAASTPSTPGSPVTALPAGYNRGDLIRVNAPTSMRTGPSRDRDEITPIDIGTQLQIVDWTSGEQIWFQVRLPGTRITGWVPAADVAPLTTSIPGAVVITGGPLGEFVPTPNVARLRPGVEVTTAVPISIWTMPSFDMEKLELVLPGTVLVVTDQPIEAIGVRWVAVRNPVTGVEGWIMSDFLTFT